MSRLGSIYRAGRLVTGLGTASTAMWWVWDSDVKNWFRDDKVKPVERMSLKEHIGMIDDRNNRNKSATCAEKITNGILGTVTYPLHLLISNETTNKGVVSVQAALLVGCAGVASGVFVGYTWPVSAPLIAMQYVEKEYGYDLCHPTKNFGKDPTKNFEKVIKVEEKN